MKWFVSVSFLLFLVLLLVDCDGNNKIVVNAFLLNPLLYRPVVVVVVQREPSSSLIITTSASSTTNSNEVSSQQQQQQPPQVELSWVDQTDNNNKNGKNDNNVTAHPSNENSKRFKNLSFDLKSFDDDKEKREMEWLIQTTAKVLGMVREQQQQYQQQQKTRPIGKMSQGLVHRAYLVMKAWAKRKEDPYLVELILQKLIEEKQAGNNHVQINTKTYNIVLDAYSQQSNSKKNANKYDPVEKIEQILSEMEETSSGNNDNGNNKNNKVKPNTSSYNALIKAIVKSPKWRNKSVQKVEEIIEKMILQNDNSKPNRRSYNLLLYAIANSSSSSKTLMIKDNNDEKNDNNGPQKATKILQLMLDGYISEKNKYVKPDINSFNQVIAAWAHGHVKGYEVQMQDVFDQLMMLPEDFHIQPNTDTFNHLLGGWLKSNDPESIIKMEETLALMEESYQNGNTLAKPDVTTINSIIAKIGQQDEGAVNVSLKFRERMQQKYDIQPDLIGMNILIDNWCKSGQQSALGHVMELLEVMERDRIADVYTYCSVIDTIIKSDIEDAAEKAEGILARMRHFYNNYGGDPANASIYNAVINAWACSGTENAASQAEALLKEMEERHRKDPFVPKPNTISYNTLIKLYCDGRPGGAERAEELLTKLEDQMQHDNNLAPDAVSYSTAITAFGRSNLEHKAEKAYEILERMVKAFEGGNRSAKPNIYAFNAALNACAFITSSDSHRKVEAFLTVVKISIMMNQYAKGDQTTYGSILRSCSTLLPPGDTRREELVQSVFEKACSEGQVGPLVLKQLKFAASAELYNKLLRGRNIEDRIHLRELPPSWTCNVSEKNRKRRK